MGASLSEEDMDKIIVPKEMLFRECHYFEKNRVFKANLMLMNNEAWDNIEGDPLWISRIRIKRNNWGDSENNGRGKIP